MAVAPAALVYPATGQGGQRRDGAGQYRSVDEVGSESVGQHLANLFGRNASLYGQSADHHLAGVCHSGLRSQPERLPDHDG
ncbi:hypothetical protein D3C76_1398030 [compost metagenome]